MNDIAKTTQITPAEMINNAIQSGADIEKLERLMDLQERWEANNAKKAFIAALSEFQSKLSPIIKKRKAHNSTYANIDDIAQAVRPIAEQCGLSYRFEQEQGDGLIKVTCVVSHIDGHSERLSMSGPVDSSGSKNAIQGAASTVTYLRRYTLTGALGITTGEDDDDGGKPAVDIDNLLQHNKVVCDEFFSISALKEALLNDDYSSAKEAWQEIEEERRMVLWRAPTKGGVLSTEERSKMKSNEWSAASV